MMYDLEPSQYRNYVKDYFMNFKVNLEYLKKVKIRNPILNENGDMVLPVKYESFD